MKTINKSLKNLSNDTNNIKVLTYKCFKDINEASLKKNIIAAKYIM